MSGDISGDTKVDSGDTKVDMSGDLEVTEYFLQGRAPLSHNDIPSCNTSITED